jgi:hypothetical protein
LFSPSFYVLGNISSQATYGQFSVLNSVSLPSYGGPENAYTVEVGDGMAIEMSYSTPHKQIEEENEILSNHGGYNKKSLGALLEGA